MRPRPWAAVLAAAGAATQSAPGCPDCDLMFCECPLAAVTADPEAVAAGLVSAVRYMRSPGGLPLSYLVPLAYWGTGGAAGTARLPRGQWQPPVPTPPPPLTPPAVPAPLQGVLDLSAAERVRMTFGLRLVDGGAAQLALALRGDWAAAAALSGVLRRPQSSALGDGPLWVYGEGGGRTFSQSDGGGYFFRDLSDRASWPDPAALAAGQCSWSDYEQQCPTDFSGSVPALWDTVWAAVIAPLQGDWLRFRLSGGHAMPSSPPSEQLLNTVLSALLASASRFGGYYEAPRRANATETLTLSVASNAALYAAAAMWAQATVDRGLQAQLASVGANCSKLLNASWAWDNAQGAFVDSAAVPDGAPAPQPTGAGWSARTQIVVLHAVGRGLDWTAQGNVTGRALKLWQRVLERYGRKNGEGKVISLVDQASPAGCAADTELTLMAAAAALGLARHYAAAYSGMPPSPGAAASLRADAAMLLQSTAATASAGLRGAAAAAAAQSCSPRTCRLRLNATIPASASKAAAAGSLAYLAAGRTALPPVPSLSATAWGVIALAAADEAHPFSPYELPQSVPGPPQGGGSGGGGGLRGWAWVVLLCSCVAALALLASIGKAFRIHSRRQRDQELKDEEQRILAQGRNLGFD
eukprot:TRINITY_DN13253_c0_g1_i2.p1 TRINITY_DN13253_c0_g1~~TRINITY_DN13253_c0_g1_i2.p1  ORF type:complete len:680 (+),score=195.08 TRINITY_DN13253_c0_g1_i2:121-2040(+)